ncbi:alpha/beta hydrolase family protein [Sulfitobacter donghicola]|uniref:Alpha/beta hydrolase n=1 Tax=Sulfitobacter donghicola DSW-25 = KCTC 12864 = JCM 14565 TaxID=1300350 RepID=A0A073IIE8_9RHOB|nr:alpha/beta fold hydrolase [Sulfitobacter donghicola]KEJ89301.1 alpha/beta hydrolase [Sulfitobacter donghicola DSW-25 = KCTC 12864 = JCM 14565]KIN69104.1 Alpha/beta hydrolase [Sulfitobacter donghicola DSW-25 = KCTC 12864 = JCM 14565]
MAKEILGEEITFAAPDGWTLAGSLFRGENPTTAILISAGTGFPRRFYKDVAQYLAQRGAVVLTYDYRGIGGSGAEDLAASGIDYPDWGRLDMPAAVDALEQACPDLQITHLAHSVGGHFIGLMPNHNKIRRHAFASVGVGSWMYHHKSYLPTEMYFWWGLGTYCLLRYGYIKPLGGWQGEALPPELFKTWRRWSNRREYFRSDYDGKLAGHHYDQVDAPIKSWIFPDDPIATQPAAESLLKSYPNAKQQIVMRSAKDIGVSRIGHEGAFRKGREELWGEFWDWLSKP